MLYTTYINVIQKYIIYTIYIIKIYHIPYSICIYPQHVDLRSA